MKATFQAVCVKESLPGIRAFAEEALRTLSVDESTAHQLILAVDEACANSIIHQHHCDGKSRIEIAIYMHGTALRIELNDIGEPFPIDKYQPSDLEAIIRNRVKGGLGISLITRIMDKVEVLKKGPEFTYRFTKFITHPGPAHG